jgi:hypothetical protein
LTGLANLVGCDAVLAFHLNALGAELLAETTEQPLSI